MNPVIILILSEILLSLYPLVIKNTRLNYESLAFLRIMIFAIISLFFIKFTSITVLFSFMGIIIGLLNYIHIQFIYKGYKELKEPVSNTIFYTYPLFIAIFGAIFFRQGITIFQIVLLIISLIGVYMINYSTIPDDKENIIYVLLASILEAFLLLILKFGNLTVIEYIASMYFWSLIFSIIRNRKSIDFEKILKSKDIIPYILFIILVGFTGLYYRFYSAEKLTTFQFSHFSYLAVIFSFIFGILLTKEKVNRNDIIGSLIIIGTILLNNFGNTFIG